MLEILHASLRRKYPYYRFGLWLGFSFLLAMLMVAVQLFVSDGNPLVTIFILINCINNSTKETDAFLQLKKFNVYRVHEDKMIKMAFFLYLKRNLYFWIGLFYAIGCLLTFKQFSANASAILLSSFILFLNLGNERRAEMVADFFQLFLILSLIFHWGHSWEIVVNGLFIASIVSNLTKKSLPDDTKKRGALFSAKINVFVRHFLLKKWKVHLFFLGLFILPLVLKWSHLVDPHIFSFQVSYSSLFSLCIYFEIMQDVHLEERAKEYSKLRLYQLLEVGLAKRVLLSDYFGTSVLVFVFSFFTNVVLGQIGASFIQLFLLVFLVFWYKIFEEKSLFQKRKPTWKLSYIRSFLPSLLIVFIAFSPQIMSQVEKIRGL